MKLLDGHYMCDLDGCSSTSDSCWVVYFPNLDMDLCEFHFYLLPEFIRSITKDKR